MKITNVSSFMPVKKANVQFKGLWGEPSYAYTDNLYGGEYECSYYDVPYHPCKDEPESVKKQIMSVRQSELDKVNKEDEKYSSGRYYRVVEDTPLNIKQSELKMLQKDCRRILNNEKPVHYLDLLS